MRWYKVVKHFRGGMREFQISVPPKIRLAKDDWDEILEWLGENTDGGHSSGYQVHVSKLRGQHPSLPVMRYPSDLVASLINYGTVVTTSRKMI